MKFVSNRKNKFFLVIFLIFSSIGISYQNNSNEKKEKELEKNTANIQMMRAKSALTSQTKRRIDEIKKELEFIGETNKSIKAGIKDKLKIIKSALSHNQEDNLNKKQLIKETKLIIQSLKYIRSLNIKKTKKEHEEEEKLNNITNKLEAYSKEIKEYEDKVHILNKEIIESTEKLKKTLSTTNATSLDKNNLIRDLDEKTLLVVETKEKIKEESEKILKLNEKKNKIEHESKENDAAFSNIFNTLYSKLNIQLTKEDQDLLSDIPVTKNSNIEEKKLAVDVKKIEEKEKIKKLEKKVEKDKEKENPQKDVKEIDPLDPLKTEVNSLDVISKESEKNKNAIAENDKSEETIRKEIEEVKQKAINFNNYQIVQDDNSTSQTINENEKYNKNIAELRKKIEKNSVELKFSNPRIINELIRDQKALNHLIRESLKRNKSGDRDLRGRSINILKKYEEKLALNKITKEKLIEDLNLVKATEILGLNSVKLAGVVSNLRANIDEDGNKSEKNNASKDIEEIKVHDLNKSLEEQINKRDKIQASKDKAEIVNIIKEDQEQKLNLIQTSEKYLVSKIKNEEKENIRLQKLNNKFVKDNNYLKSQLKEIENKFNIQKKQSEITLNDLNKQIQTNKNLISQYEKSEADLKNQIVNIKQDDKEYFSSIIFSLKDHNKILQNKVNEEKNKISELKKFAKNKNSNLKQEFVKKEDEISKLKLKLQKDDSEIKEIKQKSSLLEKKLHDEEKKLEEEDKIFNDEDWEKDLIEEKLDSILKIKRKTIK